MKALTSILSIALVYGLLNASQANNATLIQQITPSADQISRRDNVWSNETLETLTRAFKAKCSSDTACYITECEGGLSPCRPERMLMFRGENQLNTYPAISPLVRTQLAGSDFCGLECNSEKLLSVLKSEVEKLRPVSGLSVFKPIVLLPGDPRQWETKIPSWEGRPQNSFADIIISLHVSDTNMIQYKDPVRGRVAIDPLVSFSLSPFIADSIYGRGGRVIIASVPIDKLDKECGENLPAPGEVIASSLCPKKSTYQGEREVDAVMFLNPEYFLATIGFAR